MKKTRMMVAATIRSGREFCLRRLSKKLGTVIASARKGRNDLVLGNVLGSNLFNSLGVAGMSGLLGAGALATDFRPDLVVMIAIAAFAGAAAISGDRYRRVEGALMLSAYPAAIWVAL